VESCNLTKKTADHLYEECEHALGQTRKQVEARLHIEVCMERKNSNPFRAFDCLRKNGIAQSAQRLREGSEAYEVAGPPRTGC
jgi:hypothetical protein